jgi:purine nucleoside permease
VVDGGIAHEIDAREMPRGWRDGYFGVLTHSPDEMPKLEYHSEVFRLDEGLLQKALAASKRESLRDTPGLAAYRRHYAQAAARRAPGVTQCDTVSADTWWAGRRLGERASRWTQLVTEGKGVYCTSQEEDNAVLVALSRAAQAGLIELPRIAVLRGGSDFDRPYPGQSVLDSLKTQLSLPDAFPVAAENLVIAGLPLVREIVRDWPEWRHGVPPSTSTSH